MTKSGGQIAKKNFFSLSLFFLSPFRSDAARCFFSFLLPMKLLGKLPNKGEGGSVKLVPESGKGFITEASAVAAAAEERRNGFFFLFNSFFSLIQKQKQKQKLHLFSFLLFR